MAWVQLVVAGLFEIVWAVAVKRAGGLTRCWPSVLAAVAPGDDLVSEGAAGGKLTLHTAMEQDPGLPSGRAR